MSTKPSRGIIRSGKKQIRRADRKLRRANKLQRGKFYIFLGEARLSALYAGPSILSRVIDHVPTNSMVMFIETVPWFSPNRKDNWMMVRVGYGELFGYLACYHDFDAEEQTFQAHRFFKRVHA